MKKIIALLLSILLAFVLVSCTPEEQPEGPDKGDQGWYDGEETDTPIIDL